MKEKLNILILGQNGFIGKNVFSFFKKKKFNLLKYSKKKEILDLIKKTDVIINCAGNNKENFYKDNVFFLKKILNKISHKKIYFIQISSLSIYAYNFNSVKNINQITEQSIKKPISIYGKSKLSAENEIQKFKSNKNFNYTILRIGSIEDKENKNRFLNALRKIIRLNFFIYLDNKETILNILNLNKLNKILYLSLTSKLFYNNIFNLCENISLEKFLLRNSKYSYFFYINITNKIIINFILNSLSKIFNLEKNKLNYLFLKNFYSNKKINTILKRYNKLI